MGDVQHGERGSGGGLGGGRRWRRRGVVYVKHVDVVLNVGAVTKDGEGRVSDSCPTCAFYS